MTTFGGQTIPPLFGGAQDLIRLGGFGAPQTYDESLATDGSNLDKPATNAGDTLFVFANLSDPLGGGPVGWTALTGIINNNQGRIYTRIADDTALDNFAWAAGQFSNGIAIFASFVTEPGFFLGNTVNNVQLQVTNTAWGINNFLAGNGDSLVFCLMTRSAQGIGGAFSVDDDVDIANVIIQSGENHGAFNHALWRFWGWEFEATSRAHSAGDLTYAPTQNASTKTRFARFELTVIP
jgi:hypothetical protein